MPGSRPSKFECSSLEKRVGGTQWILSRHTRRLECRTSSTISTTVSPGLVFGVCVCVCLAGEPGDDTHRTTQFFLRKLNRENFNMHMCNSVCVLSITMASCKG